MVLKNASVPAQIAWAKMTPKQRSEIVKKYHLRDTDKDGVYNGFDCHPKDKRRQESFLPDELQYIEKHPVMKRGNQLGAGESGLVYDVKGNKKLVVKTQYYGRPIDKEEEFFRVNKLEKEPLFIASKAVKVTTYNKNTEFGIVRPKVTPIMDPYGITKRSAFTDARLKELKMKITKLSNKGFVFDDGLQLGIDSAGKLVQFDIGEMQKVDVTKPKMKELAYKRNNGQWVRLLKDLGIPISKYGEIKLVTATTATASIKGSSSKTISKSKKSSK